MYERLRTLYADGRLSDAQLTAAVGKGWVTQAQADAILGGD